MTPEYLLQKLQAVPYEKGAGTWSGMDCWGLVEIWFHERFGIELADRRSIAPGPQGIEEGFHGISDWCEVVRPQNDDLVVMRFGRLRHGHVGIFWNGSVLHCDEHAGCVLQPVAGRQIRPRITCYLRHKSFV